MTTGDELIEVLRRRHTILESLRDAPKERHELVDHLEDSKSTIYKGVTQLEALGLLEATSEGLQPTLFGLVALERYSELAKTAEFRPVLEGLPRDSIPPSALLGADVVTPNSQSVARHFDSLHALLADADRIRGFSPAISPAYVSTLRQRIADAGIAAELVFPTELIEHLKDEYPKAVQDVLAAEDAQIYQTTQELPFTLVLLSTPDGQMFCIEVEEDGLTTGLVINDAPAGFTWAESTFEQQKRVAMQIN